MDLPRTRGDGLDDTGQRIVRVLVARELEALGRRRAPLAVWGKGGDLGAEPNTRARLLRCGHVFHRTPSPRLRLSARVEPMRFIVKVIVIAFALWLTTFLVDGVSVVPYENTQLATVLTYLLVAVIFGLVNAIVGTFIRIVAFPLYVLTLGLISFIVNGLLLLLVDWISGLIGFGLVVDSFWWGVLGALVLGLISWLI